MPTLGEFIAQARQYGFRRRTVTLGGGRRGADVIVYLWRDPDHFAELPPLRQSDRLTRDAVETLCRQLGLPGEDFGLTGDAWREPASLWNIHRTMASSPVL